MKDFFDISTPRLLVHPLEKKALFDFVFLRNKFINESNLDVPDNIIDPELLASLTDVIFPQVNKNKNILFYTLWLIILKEKNQAAGIFCMKGEPDEQGEIEIGYSIGQQFRNKGLMTEALRAIVYWFDNFPEITTVKAETLSDNYSSIRVLEKVGFRLRQRKGDYLLWKLMDLGDKQKKSI